MAKPQFRRFSTFHVGIHWLVALPYMILMASGAVLIVEHLGWVGQISPGVIWNTHRVVGIAFVFIAIATVASAAFSKNARSVAQDVYSWFAIGRDDRRWLARLPGNVLFPRRYAMVPAGRFNAGQKIHGAFVVLAIAAFSVTGVLMILQPGNLNVWLIHTWLFFAAAAFLLLHIYMAIVNPPTRRALGGVITGRVPVEYVREHHPLVETGQPCQPAAGTAVSLKVLALAIFIALGLAAAWWVGAGHRLVQAAIDSPQENPMIFPGKLIAPHSREFIGGHCSGCHMNGGSAVDEACLQCHFQIRQMMESGAGFHGKLTGSCVKCHVEHHGATADLRNFNPATFDHSLARFPLSGAHASIDCDRCHVSHAPKKGERQYIGIKFQSCTECHANPHLDPTFIDCKRCHGELNWTPSAASP